MQATKLPTASLAVEPPNVSGGDPGSGFATRAEEGGPRGAKHRALTSVRFMSPRTFCNTCLPLASIVALFDEQGFQILFAMRKGTYSPSMKKLYKEFHKVKFLLRAEQRSALEKVLGLWLKAFKRTLRVLYLIENSVLDDITDAISASDSLGLSEGEAYQVGCAYPQLPTTLW